MRIGDGYPACRYFLSADHPTLAVDVLAATCAQRFRRAPGREVSGRTHEATQRFKARPIAW